MGQELVGILYTNLREVVLEVVHVLSSLSVRLDLSKVKLIMDLFSGVSLGNAGLVCLGGRSIILIIAVG